MADTAPVVAAAYDRWADTYARLVRHAPGVSRLRRLAVDELSLATGDTVLDMGCGPGVNFPVLREAVGPTGRVIGLDIAPKMLDQAARNDPTAELVLGDAARAPIDGPVDGILATFVITLFEDPTAVIDRWWSMLAPGGALAVVNLAPMRGPVGTLGNPLLELGLRFSTPTRSAYDDALIEVLGDRVDRTHRAMDERAHRLHYVDSADGLFRVTVGTRQA